MEMKNLCGKIPVELHLKVRPEIEDTRANEKAFENGWFKTGDLGYIDRDGFLFVCGRPKSFGDSCR